MSVADYIAMKGLNWSTLKHSATSLLLYRYRLENPTPSKPAFTLGGAAHCLALEPERFAERYALCEITRDKRHKAFQDWMEKNPGRGALNPGEWERAHAVAEAIRSHPVAGKVLSGGEYEVSMQWTCPHTGVLLKGRADYITDRIPDLKTARAVDERSTGRAMADYLYHGQLAMYHDGARELGLIPRNARPPLIVWVENSEPFDVAVDEFTEWQLEAGRILYVSLIRRVQTAIELDRWPGQAPNLRTLNLPPFALGAEDNPL